jgi:murein DD-endopeptidase MepM/ murein hydrolase activator NlpD
VRLFPRSTTHAPAGRHALVAVAAAGLMLGTALPATGDNLDDKKDNVEEHIDDQQADLDESTLEVQAATAALLQAQADLTAAQQNLARTRGELAAAEALDRQMQTRLDAAVQRLGEARQALADGRADVAEQEDELKRMVVASYEQGDPALMGLSMVFTTQDPAQLAGNMNATSTAVNMESSVLDQLEAAKVLLTVKETEMASAKAEVAEQRRAAAKNLALKQTLEDQAVEAEQKVSDMVSLRTEARATAMKAKSSDLAALAQLQAERDRIEELIRQQAAAASTGYTGVVDGGGFLDVPVTGPITSPYGWRIHPIYGYRSLHDGDDFGAACGTPIRAAAPGRVLTEYYQTAWGNRIIIDHGVHRGVNVSTISNHLSGYAVSTGEHVDRGQVVGYVGTTGWSTGCHLHFTVLQNGVATDPVNWF